MAIDYFAYGSNLLDARLRARLPAVVRCSSARLPGHRLRFDKRGGSDGSGKGHVVPSSAAGEVVWGVLYHLDDAERARLDAIEGVGHGYTGALRTVLGADGRAVEAMLYVAEPTAVVPDLEPYDWYLALVIAGAVEAGFPADYIARLRAVRCRRDADTARALDALRLIDPNRETY